DFPPTITNQKVIEQFMAKFYEENEEQREREEIQEKTRVQDKRLIEDDESDKIEEEVELIENDGLVSLQVISEESDEAENTVDVVEIPQERDENIKDKEFEKLKDQYKKDTGKRPIYAGKETKGFLKWLDEFVKECKELAEKVKEQEEMEEWQKILMTWIDEATEEELSTELKKKLTEILHEHEFYEEIRKIYYEFKRLIKKFINGEVSNEELKRLILISEKIKNIDIIHLNLNENLRNFKFYYRDYVFDFLTERVWGSQDINKLRERFINRLSEKFKQVGPKGPYTISSKKKVLISSWLEHIPKNTRGYASIKLLADLQVAIQTQSQKLAVLFPQRVSRFKLSHLSNVTGISDNILRQSRSSKYSIEKSLNCIEIIETSLLDRYSREDIELSLALIEKYRVGPQKKEFYKDVMDGICLNLGELSGLVRVNYPELSLVLKAKSKTNSKSFVHDIIQWIIYKNNEYSLSLEEVEDYKDILKGWILDDAEEILDIINNYIKQNPDIDQWNKQQTKIPKDKINYFGSLITLPEKFMTGKVSQQEFEEYIQKMFFFGFLCADGWISGNRIGMELTWGDKDVLHSLAKEIGLPKSKVSVRERPMTYKGKTKWYKSATLRFGCKGIVKDLKNLGKFGSKSLMGQVPQVVKDLIRTSKEMELSGMKDSELPLLMAKAWLYGFYNGDGSIGQPQNEKWISPVIIAGNKKILEDISHEFGLDYTPRTVHEPGELVLMFDHNIISKGVYIINLGADFFRSLIKDLYSFTYDYDLERKRALPDDNMNYKK
ncbi:MAG: hypothetical protein ACTSPN_16000, partial [Promethearchaeota archaeon]